MLAAGGLLILLAMGYTISGMISEDDPGATQTDGLETDPAEGDTDGDGVGMTEGAALSDLLFGSDGDDPADDVPATEAADGAAQSQMLRLGLGDEATGVDGEDIFAVGMQGEGWSDGDATALPRISDFQSGIDRLILEFDGPEEDLPEISFDTDNMPDATIVLANGVPAAILLGVGAMDLSDVEVLMIGSDGDIIGDPAGDDILTGTDDHDTIDSYPGDGLLDGGTDQDQLRGREGMVSLLGGGHEDAITGGFGHDTIEGGPGNDMLVGNEGNDTIFGGAGADEAYGEDGDDWIEGGAGTDFLVGGDGDDSIAGGDDGDMIFGNDGNDLLSGDEGDDYLQGGFGADTLLGGAGNDRLDGTFTSGASIFETFDEDEGDVLDGGAGDDTILVGAHDIATGGEGADRFVTGSYIETAEVAGHVTDFDPRQDVIEVIFDPDLTPDPLITVEDFDDGTGANILFEGQLILSVSGAQGLDPALIELREVTQGRVAELA